jgi:hypothetical protein
MINHCDRRITHLSATDIFFVLFNISSEFLLYLECYILSRKMHKKVSKWIKQGKKYISITKKSDTDISKIQDNLSDIRSGNLEKLSDGKKNLSDRIKT